MNDQTGLKNKLDQIFEREGKFFRRLEGGKEEEMRQIVATNIIKKGDKFFQRKVITLVPLGNGLSQINGEQDPEESNASGEKDLAEMNPNQSKAETLPRIYVNDQTNSDFRKSGETQNEQGGFKGADQKTESQEPISQSFQGGRNIHDYGINERPEINKASSSNNHRKISHSSERQRKFELLSEFSSGKDRQRTSLGESLQNNPETEQLQKNYHLVNNKQKQFSENPETHNVSHQERLNETIPQGAKETSENLKKLPLMFKSVKSMYQVESNGVKALQKIEEENSPSKATETNLENQSQQTANNSEDRIQNSREFDRNSKDERDSNGQEDEVHLRIEKRSDEIELDDMGDSHQMQETPGETNDSGGPLQYVQTEYVERHIDWRQNVDEHENRNQSFKGEHIQAFNRENLKVLEENEENQDEEMDSREEFIDGIFNEYDSEEENEEPESEPHLMDQQSSQTQKQFRVSHEQEISEHTVKTRDKNNMTFGFQDEDLEPENGRKQPQGEYYEQPSESQGEQAVQGEDTLNQYYGEPEGSEWSQDEQRNSEFTNDYENEKENLENNQGDIEITTKKVFYKQEERNQNQYEDENENENENYELNVPENHIKNPQIMNEQKEPENLKFFISKDEKMSPEFQLQENTNQVNNIQNQEVQRNHLKGQGEDIITKSGGILRTQNLTPAMRRALLNERKGICCGVRTRTFRPPGNPDDLSNQDDSHQLKNRPQENEQKQEQNSTDEHQENEYLEFKKENNVNVRGKRVIVSLCDMDSRVGASHDSEQKDHRIIERKIKIQKQKNEEYNLEINSNDTTLEGIRVSSGPQEYLERFQRPSFKEKQIEIRNGIGSMNAAVPKRADHTLPNDPKLGPSMSLNSFLKKIRKSHDQIETQDIQQKNEYNLKQQEYAFNANHKNRFKPHNDGPLFQEKNLQTRDRKTTHHLPEELRQKMEGEMGRETVSINEISYDKYHDDYVGNSDTIENYKTRVRQGQSREIGRRRISKPHTSIINNINTQYSNVYPGSLNGHPDPKFQSQRDYSYGEYYENSFSYQNPNTLTNYTQTYPNHAMIDHSLTNIKTRSKYDTEPKNQSPSFKIARKSAYTDNHSAERQLTEYKQRFRTKIPDHHFDPRGMTSMEQMCYGVEELDHHPNIFGRESLIDTSRDMHFDQTQREAQLTKYKMRSRESPGGNHERKGRSQEVMVKIRAGNSMGKAQRKGGFGQLKKMRKGWIDSLRVISSKLLMPDDQHNPNMFGSERKPRHYSLKNKQRFSEQKAYNPYKHNRNMNERNNNNEYGYETQYSKFNPALRQNIKHLSIQRNSGHTPNVNHKAQVIQTFGGKVHYQTPEKNYRNGVKSLSKVMTSLNHYVKGMLRESLRKKKAVRKNRFKNENMTTKPQKPNIDVKKVFDDYNFGEEDKKYFTKLEKEFKNEKKKMSMKRERTSVGELDRYRQNDRHSKHQRFSHGRHRYSHNNSFTRKRDKELGIRRIDRGVFRTSVTSETEQNRMSKERGETKNYFQRGSVQPRGRKNQNQDSEYVQNRTRYGSVPIRSKARASSEPPAKRTEYIECQIDPKKRIPDMKAYIQNIYDRHNRRKEEMAKQQMIRLQRDSELKQQHKPTHNQAAQQHYNQQRPSTHYNPNITLSFDASKSSGHPNVFMPSQPQVKNNGYIQTPYFVPEYPKYMTYRDSNNSRKISHDSQNQYMSTISMSNPHGRNSKPINDSGIPYFVSERASNGFQGQNEETISFKGQSHLPQGIIHQNRFVNSPANLIISSHHPENQSNDMVKYSDNQKYLISGVDRMVHQVCCPNTQHEAKSKETIKTLAGGSQNFFTHQNSVKNKFQNHAKHKSRHSDDPYAFHENLKIAHPKIPRVNLNTQGEIFLKDENQNMGPNKREATTRFGNTSLQLVSSTHDQSFPKRINLNNYLPTQSKHIHETNKEKAYQELPKQSLQNKNNMFSKIHFPNKKVKLPDFLKQIASNKNKPNKLEFPTKLLKNVRVSKSGKVYRTSKSPNRKIGINEFDKVVRKRGRLGFGIRGKVLVNPKAESAQKKNRN